MNPWWPDHQQSLIGDATLPNEFVKEAIYPQVEKALFPQKPKVLIFPRISYDLLLKVNKAAEQSPWIGWMDSQKYEFLGAVASGQNKLHIFLGQPNSTLKPP